MAGKIATWTDVSAKGYGKLSDSTKWKKCPKKSEIKNFGCFLNSTGEGYAASRLVPEDYILSTSSLFEISWAASILPQGRPDYFILDGTAATSFSDATFRTIMNCGMIPEPNSAQWNTQGVYNTSTGWNSSYPPSAYISNNGTGAKIRYVKTGTPNSSVLQQVILRDASIYIPMTGSRGRLQYLYGMLGFKAGGISGTIQENIDHYLGSWFGVNTVSINGPAYIKYSGKAFPCYNYEVQQGVIFHNFILTFEVREARAISVATSSLDELTYEEVIDGSIYRIEPLYDENGPIVSPFAPEPPQALLDKDPSVFDIEDPISGEIVGTVEIRTISWEELYGEE